MIFIFETDNNGKIIFDNSKYMFSTATGLNDGNVTRRQINYIDTDGAEFIDDLYEPREIKIEGCINASSMREQSMLRANLTRICNGKARGKLVWRFDNKKYFTEVIAELPSFGTRVGLVQPFICTFNAYNFYWKDYSETQADVVSFEDHIKTQFKLPLVFSSRISKADIMNNGSIEANIKIIIECSSTSGTSGVLNIYNRTTGKSIILNHNLSEGETVVIDTANCDVESSIEGSLIDKLEPESEFFKLIPGANTIEVINSNTDCIYHCICKHYNTYVGV